MPARDSAPLDEGPVRRRFRRLVAVREGETEPSLWSAAYYFCLLCGYYIVRPLRDEIGAADRDNLQVLWTGTFVAMLLAVPLYSFVVSRFQPRVFVALVYRFFIVNLVLFYALLQLVPEGSRIWVERGFYIWASVFNLFAVTAFWGFLVDLFRNDQGRRLFGFIAMGGTVGAVAGSWLTASLADTIAPVHLLLFAAVLLEAAAQCVRILHRVAARTSAAEAPAAEAEPRTPASPALVPGGVLTGIAAVFRSPYLLGICAYLFLHTLCATFMYFEQSHVIGEAIPDRAQRTVLLARMDMWVNILAIGVQAFLTGRIIGRIGVGLTLTLLPAITVLMFVGLGTSLTLGAIVVFQVLRRATNFALGKPAREILFTVVGREEKYKSKAFIDTVVYRGGDMVSGWMFSGLKLIGLSLAAIALTAVPLAGIWIVIGLVLGRRQDRLVDAASSRGGPE